MVEKSAWDVSSHVGFSSGIHQHARIIAFYAAIGARNLVQNINHAFFDHVMAS